MKENLRRLQVLSTLIDIELFYTIGVSDNGITLQGFFKPTTVQLILKNKFKQAPVSPNGYMELERGNIKITLT